MIFLLFLLLGFAPLKQAEIPTGGFTVSGTEEPAMTGCTANPQGGFRMPLDDLAMPVTGISDRGVVPAPLVLGLNALRCRHNDLLAQQPSDA